MRVLTGVGRVGMDAFIIREFVLGPLIEVSVRHMDGWCNSVGMGSEEERKENAEG